MGSLHQHADLAQALQAAREEAHRRPIVKTTLAKGGEKNPEAEWYFAATDEMMLVALDILKAHGLRLNWKAMDAGPLGVTTWATLRHESGELEDYTWGPFPPFEDAATTAHGGLGVVRHAMRCLHLMILEIQVISMATSDRLKREAEAAQLQSDSQEVRAAVRRMRDVASADRRLPPPGWAWSPALTGSSDAVYRAGDDTGSVSLAEAWRRFDDEQAPAPDYQPPSTVSAEDHDLPTFWQVGGGLEAPAPLPGELEAEADAAARGEVRDPPGVAELGLLLGRVRALTGKSGPELRRAAGVPERGPLDDGARAALFAHLSRLAGPEAT